MAFTNGNDINILQQTDLLNVGAGLGNDRYVLDNAVLLPNQKITISDTTGSNILQLVGGLSIVASRVTTNAVQLTLDNGILITVLGADQFSFQTGGNPVRGTGGQVQNFQDFVTQALGVNFPQPGTAFVQGSTVTVNDNGGTTRAAVNNNLSALAQAQSVTVNGYGTVAGTNTHYVDTLNSNFYWNKSLLTYSFNNTLPSEYAQDPSLTTGWRSLNSTERQAVRSALADSDEFIAADFQEVSINGDIRFNVVAMTEPNVAAFAYYPGSSAFAGDMFLGADRPGLNFTPGRHGYATVVHELGHSLGLKHPFEDGATLPASLDNKAYSIMSYTQFRALEFVATWNTATSSVSGRYESTAHHTQFSLFDVQALHAAYGPETSTRTGNDIYTVGDRQYLTIWDAGGVDTIDLSQTQGASRINLQGGTLSSANLQSIEDLIAHTMATLVAQGATNAAWLRDWVTSAVTDEAAALYNGENNLAIVQGAIIENVRTGSNNDEVWDNAVNNVIATGSGNDRIYLGLGGFDQVDGGLGQDTVIFQVASSALQRETQSDGSLLVVGQGFAAQLVGVEILQFTDQQILWNA